MSNLIIGTAGHIDHGKTTLIKALTGDDTDRLKEEKERGISIELGFTQITLKDKKASIIDVPGHEKFIKTMISGATSIGVVLLVISCDDGIMPQTIEHFQILKGLGINSGIIVLTKGDKASKDVIDIIKEDIKEEFKGSFLENSKVIVTSCKTNEGIDELKNEIYNTLEERERNNNSKFRMYIDRVFSLKGLGTIVTGTVCSGNLTVNDEIFIPNISKGGTVKKIENHGIEKVASETGERVALNLSGVSKNDIKRGFALTNYSLNGSRYLEGKLEDVVLNREIKNGERIRLYIGTFEVLARVKKICNEKNYIRLNLEEECYVEPFDRFYMRTYSPLENIGGGRILNIIENPKKKYGKEDLERLWNIEEGRELENRFKSEIWINKEEVNLNEELILIGDVLFSKESLKYQQNKMKIWLQEYFKKNNLREGVLIEELRKQVFNDSFKVKWLNDFLSKSNEFFIKDGLVSLKGHNVVLKRYQENFIKEALFKLSKEEYNKRELLELSKKYNFKGGEFSDLIKHMMNKGLIVELDEEKFFESNNYNELIRTVIEYIKKNGSITLANARDLIGKNRDITLSLLEKMDECGLTTRVENKRILN